jgi:dienelactone hydrolase
MPVSKLTLRTTALLVMSSLLAAITAAPALGQSAEPSPGSPQAAATGRTAPQVLSYDLGTVTIQQSWMAEQAPGLVDMPVRLQGVVAVPGGEGPFPVALLMHGSYPFCTAMAMADDPAPYPCPPEDDLRQYEGFADLAAALAADGYLALVPDMAPEYAEGFGSAPFGERAIQIADAHLDALSEGTGFPVDVAGKADLDQLVIAGHSRGGSLIVRYATDETARHTPKALALLTPAYLAPKSLIPGTMPALLVISECDGDVGTEQPLKFYKKQLPPLRPAPTLVYTIANGTHNGFSTTLEREVGPSCEEADLMAPEQQRAIAGDLLPRFFDLALAASDY